MNANKRRRFAFMGVHSRLSWLLWVAAVSGEECSTLLSRGRFAYESKKYDAAAAEFERAAAACSQPHGALLSLAQAQLLAQRFPETIATLRKLLAVDPRNVAARKLEGDAQYLAGNEPEAERAFLQALELDSGNESALYALGRIYYQQNRFPEAIVRFKKVIAVNPKSYRAYDNLALCHEALNEDQEAVRNFLKALDLVYKDHPEYDWAYANMANFYLKRDQNEKAFQLAAEAAKRNPLSARNFFLTGKALFKLEKNDLSVRWLEQAIALDPAYPEPRYLLGQVYRKLGRNEEAGQQLQQFQELSQKPRARR